MENYSITLHKSYNVITVYRALTKGKFDQFDEFGSNRQTKTRAKTTQI